MYLQTSTQGGMCVCCNECVWFQLRVKCSGAGWWGWTDVFEGSDPPHHARLPPTGVWVLAADLQTLQSEGWGSAGLQTGSNWFHFDTWQSVEIVYIWSLELHTLTTNLLFSRLRPFVNSLLSGLFLLLLLTFGLFSRSSCSCQSRM